MAHPPVVRSVGDLAPDFEVAALPARAEPRALLVCPPDHYEVIDEKNPHMRGAIGTVDRALAREQWERLAEVFRGRGLEIARIVPVPGCEDMVFCANQTFTGNDAAGSPVCLLSHMRHLSRRREVSAFDSWFRARGWRVADEVPEGVLFEGGGDALWHPGRRLIWAAHGFRSGPEAHDILARVFGVTVLSLELADERFYHLDTCVALLDESTALVHPGALRAPALELLRRLVPRIIEVSEDEAVGGMACNAAMLGGVVVMDRRGVVTARRLESLGYTVIRVDTGEYLKSGGSVYCMKQLL